MIYVVTNRKMCRENSFLYTIEKCLDFGADAIILREKDLDYKELYSLGEKTKLITDKYNVPLIINGNLDVAKNLHAWGYHCGITKIREEQFNEKGLKLGLSVHSLSEAEEVERLGGSYLIAGHIYETDCKAGLKGRGIKFLKEIVDNTSIPVIAIGGIKENNIEDVINTGAKGAAIMSSAMKDPSVVFRLKNYYRL